MEVELSVAKKKSQSQQSTLSYPDYSNLFYLQHKSKGKFSWQACDVLVRQAYMVGICMFLCSAEPVKLLIQQQTMEKIAAF